MKGTIKGEILVVFLGVVLGIYMLIGGRSIRIRNYKSNFGCVKLNNMLDFEANMEEIKRSTPVGFKDMYNYHPSH